MKPIGIRTVVLCHRLLAVLALASMAANCPAAVTHRVVAVSGQPNPSNPTENLGDLFAVIPVVNTRGHVAFVAPVGPPAAGNTALFVNRDSLFIQAARSAQPVPGYGPELFGRLSDPALNDDGEVFVFSSLPGAGKALLSNADVGWRFLVRERDSAPGLPAGSKFESIQSANFDPGQLIRSDGPRGVVFRGFARPGTGPQRAGLWRFIPGNPILQPPVLLDEPAPNLNGGEVLDLVHEVVLAASPLDVLAFLGQLKLETAGVNSLNDEVVWAGAPGAPLVVAREGEPLPTPFADQTFGSFRSLSVNGAGDLAFVAEMVSASTRAPAVLTGGRNTLAVVVRAGDAAPGRTATPLGVFSYFHRVAINGAGQIVMEAQVDPEPGGLGELTSTASALYRWTPGAPGTLTLLARTGEGWSNALPGWKTAFFLTWNLNASGRVAFHAMAANEANSAFGNGLWLTDGNDRPVLLAQAGIPGTPDVLALARMLAPASLVPTGGQDGRARFLSDNPEQVVFGGTLSNFTSAIFVASILEPPSEEFTLSLSTNAMVCATEVVRIDGTNKSGTLLDAALQAAPTKNWTGARLTVAMTAGAMPGDRLGIHADAGSPITVDGVTVRHLGVEVGVLESSDGLTNQVVFNTNASTMIVQALLRQLAYAHGRHFLRQFEPNLRHREPARGGIIRLEDADGHRQSVPFHVEFDQCVGLVVTLPWDVSPFRRCLLLGTEGVNPNGPSLKIRLGGEFSCGATVWLGHENTDPPDIPYLSLMVRPAWKENGASMSFANGVTHDSFANGFGLQRVYTNDSSTGQPQAPSMIQAVVDNFSVRFLPGIFESDSCILPSLQAPCLSPRAEDLLAAPMVLHASAVEPNPLPAFLPALYALQSWMARSAEGQRLTALYYRHTSDVGRLLVADPAAAENAVGVITNFLCGLTTFLAGQGGNAVITQPMIDQLNALMTALADAGSAELRAVIADERARFNGFQDFVGKDFAEWGQMLAWGAPTEPFIQLSNPRRDAGRFTTEANRIPGLDYSLQRARTLPAPFWEPVTNAEIRLGEFDLELTDPAATNALMFYRLQVLPPR